MAVEALADGGQGGGAGPGAGGIDSLGGAGGVGGSSASGGGGGGGAGVTGGQGGNGTTGTGGLGGQSAGANGQNATGTSGGGGGAHGQVLPGSGAITVAAGGDGGAGGGFIGGGGAGGYGAAVTGLGAVTNSGAIAGGSGGTGASGGSGGIGIAFGSSGSTLANGGAIGGGSGGQAVAGGVGNVGGNGGAGVSGVGLLIDNTGAIGGGSGGEGVTAGNGGAGISGSGLVINNSVGAVISGGVGGLAPEGHAGMGGAGISGSSSTIANSGAIGGGSGGAFDGSGGAGITGSNLTIVNTATGQIVGGSNAGGGRANAITFTGGTNVLELHAGSTITGNAVAFSAADTLRLGGSVDASFDVGQIGAAAQFQNFGQLAKSGTSTWTLTGTGAYSGATTVSAGTLVIDSSSALPNTTDVTVNTGATLTISDNAGFAIANSLAGGGTVNLGPTSGTGSLTLEGNVSTTFSGTFAGNGSLFLDNGNLLTLTGTAGSSGTIGGDLILCSCGPTGGLTIDGTALTVVGQAEGVTVDGGTLTVTNGGTLTVGPSPNNSVLTVMGTMNITGAGSTATVNGATGIGIFGAGTLNISGGGRLNSLAGAIIDGFISTATATVTGTGSTWAIAGDLDVGNGVLGGPGILSVASGGAVTVSGDARVGDQADGSSLATVSGGGSSMQVAGQLQIGSSGVTQGTLTVADGGGVTAVGGTSIASGSTLNLGTGGLAGALATPTLVNNGAVVANFTDTLTLSADISGAGTLTKNGPGTLILSGTNTYSGGTTVTAGTLQGTTASLQGDILNNAAVVFNQAIDGTYAGAMSGAGSLTKSGIGVLTLTSPNTYSGGTTITAGTLGVGNGGALGTGGLVLAGGNLRGVANVSLGNNISFTTGGGAISAATGTTLTLAPTTFSFGLVPNTVITFGSASDNGTVVYSSATGFATNVAFSTVVSGGTLRAGAATFGSLTGNVQTTTVVGAGATLDFNDFSSTITNLQGAGTVLTGANSTTVLTIAGGSYAGAISGAGQLVKTGSGMLTLGGINTYTGPTTVNAGVLALNGSIAGNATVNAGATIMGTGTVGGGLTVAGTVAPGNSIGTLNVGGSYTQSAGSTYTVEVNNAGQSDRINVAGTATINGGAVVVQAAPGTYQRTNAYTILSATGGISGTYSGVSSNLAFLTSSLTYDANTVTLMLFATANSFQNGGQTPNQRAVGAVLDQASLTATGDFATVLNGLYSLDTTQGPQVLDALGGQNYSGFSSLMVQGSLLFMNSFQIQAGSGQTSGASSGLPNGSTYQALKTDDCLPTANACDVEPLWGVWGGGMGAFGTVAGDGNGNGLSYNLGGFVAGLDRKFTPNFRAGIAAGFNAASVYTNGMPGTGTSNTVQVALYGEYLQGPFYVDALAGYGHSDNRMTRPIVIPGLPYRAAQGYTTANTFFGQLEAGYKLVVAPSFGGFVTPFARLQGVTSTQNGFTESGADSLNLTVAAQTTNSLRTVLGAQLGAAIDAPWREKLNLTMRLGWSHEFADTARPVNASFAGAPALGFTTQGAQAPRDGVVIGFGGNTSVAERTSVYLRYDGDLAGGNTNHVLSAGVRYVW